MRLFLLYLYLLLFALLPGTVKAQLTEVRLQLKWWHQFQFAGYYAADLKGFYKDAGLKVTILPGDKDHPPVQEVLNGNADYGVTGSDILLNFTDREPVHVLGAIFQHSPYVIISLAKNNINSPSDLVGKTIMGSKDQGWVQLRALALKEGINPGTFNVIKHSWNNDDLVSGKVDAMTGYSSVEVYQLQQKGIEVKTINPINYGIDFYGDILFCLKKTASKKHDVTEKFMKASFKGWLYALDHPAELADYILTMPGVKERGVTKNALLFEAAEMRKLILPELIEMGHMNAGRWQHMLNVYKRLRLIPQDRQLEGFIYNAEKTSMSNYFRKGMYILGGVLLLLGLLFGYSISLKNAVRNRTRELENEINQRKKNEADLKELSKELQISNQELQQFAYISSHNLRSPVSNLISLVNLFDKKSLSEKNAVYFNKIDFCTNNINQLLIDLNEILSARKPVGAELNSLQFEQELNLAKQAISEELQSTQARILADFSRAPQLLFSRDIMHSIFLNLLTNAVKYRKDGSFPVISIRSYEQREATILEFSDEGIGMDLEKYGNRVFNIYQRFHPQFDGKGLGLYLVKTQLEKMGGNIQVKSFVNKGTTFTISFKKITD